MEAPTIFSAVSGSRVDREAGILLGVSVITEGEAKGHPFSIDQTTLSQVKACAEEFSDGVQVKVNHGTGFDSIVGVLRNFRIDGQKLIADLHLLKNHEMRERILEIAEQMPGSVGLSIAFSGKNENKMARCSELYSVDFVDRPAANPSGLFRGVDSPPMGMDSKSLLSRVKEFFSQVEKEMDAPVTLEAKNKDLENQLAAKGDEVKTLSAKITELEAAKTKADAELKAANEKLGSFDAEVKKLAAIEAAKITAAQGQPPIPDKPNDNPADALSAKKKEISELKGLAKVIALEKLESQTKGN